MGITLIGAMLMVSFSGCGTDTSAATTAAKEMETAAAADNTDKTIYLITGQTTEYISMLTKASAKAAGCELKVYDAEADLYKETQLIQLAVNDEADRLIIIPTASDDVSQILKEAGDMNVVILNRELADMAVEACLNLINGKAYDEGLERNTDKDNPYITYTGWRKVTADNVGSYKDPS